jgi:hypothetical protein
VELQVEVRVVDPPGSIERKRHGHQSLTEAPRHVQPRFDEAQDLVETEPPAAPRRRVVDLDHRYLVLGMQRVHVEHGPVGVGELSHGVVTLVFYGLL